MSSTDRRRERELGDDEQVRESFKLVLLLNVDGKVEEFRGVYMVGFGLSRLVN